MKALGRNALTTIALIELIVLSGVLVYYNTLPPNAPPVANAGEPRTVWAGYPIQLDGSGSYDPEGGKLLYVWSIVEKPEGSMVTLSDRTAVNPSFIPDKVGVYNFSLIVYDGLSYSLPSYVTITAKPWFIDVAMKAGVMFGPTPPEDRRSDMWMGPGCGWADYDNDGDQDLYVPFCGFYHLHNLLYRNNGDGTFIDVAVEAGVSYNPHGNTYGVVWGDYDNDGDLDLYLANYGNSSRYWDPGEANILYRNNGDGTFTDVTEEAGVGDTRHSIAAAWGDYNNDGWLDLFVANRGIVLTSLRQYMNETSALYRNNGDGTFTDVAAEVGICQGVTGGPFPFAPGERKVGRVSGHWWQPIWFDYNDDGYLDLFITSDLGTSLLYRNNGPPSYNFTDVTKEAGLWVYNSGMGADVGDFDNDGDLDIYNVNSNDFNNLFRNDIANVLGNNWIRIRLNGTVSNRYGIGAIVKVTSGNLTQTRQLIAGAHYESCSSLPARLHFGLGKRTIVDRIEIRWPSGIVQVLTNIEVNQTITITEPSRAEH